MSKFSTAILAIPNFRNMVLTRTFVITATQAQAVIVGWQVYSITKSPFMLGMTGLVEAVPAILCALYAGHIVDISHPQKILVRCLIAMTINALALVMFAGGFIPLDDHALLLVIFTGVFISGLARSFIMPSAFALLPLVVKREDISSASSWQTTSFQIAAIGGPTAAGFIYGFYGVQIAWLMVLAGMILSVLSASRIKVDIAQKIFEVRPSVTKSIREGWVFLLENRALLSIMSLDMLAVLFGGALAILPAFAEEVLNVGSEGLGILRAAPAMGAVLTALYFALKPMKHITGMRMFIVVAGFGVCMIGFGWSTNLWMAVFFLSLSGAFDSVSMVIRGTLMQLLTPDHMKGRVSAVNSMFIISSNEIGAFESGVAASLFGLVPSIIIGGLGTMVVVAVVAYASPKFRKLSVQT